MITREHDKKLFLLDAYALIFRAYYAFIRTPRINSKGLNTSAMFGFTNTLLDILNNEKPTHIAVVFDAPEQTLREIDYEAYKANREETPEDIKLSVPWIMKIIEAFGIPILMKGGYEADDVIGTLAKEAEKEGFLTYMMTSDKDYGQLVSENIFIYKPGYQGGGAEVLGIPEVLEKFSIERVDQVIDILGMMGDAVDNIPGIPGVGEKTAVKLLKEFGSLEGLLANTDKLKGKQKENVETYADQAILSKKLATILLDAPVPLSEEELRVKPLNREMLRGIFNELEFRQLAKRVLNEESEAVQPTQGTLFDTDSSGEIQPAVEALQLKTINEVPHNYRMADTPELLQQLISDLKESSAYSFDTETSDLEPLSARLVGLSFSTSAHKGWYVPVPEDEHGTGILLKQFEPVFHDTTKTLIGQNYKFDFKMLMKYGIEVRNTIFDTMIAHYLINPDSRHGMDELSRNYLGYTPISIEELIGKKGKSQGTMADLSPEQILDYAAEDADVTYQLYERFAPELEKAGLTPLFRSVEVPLIEVLAQMEWDGVRVDEAFLKEYSAQLKEEIDLIEKDIHELAGERFNIDSPKQLGPILFEKLGIATDIKKTKTGQYSTSEDVLSRYEHSHPIVAKILDYRELRKLKSTYVDSLPTMIHPATGRVHTNYMQAVAATGRLSSNNPNLQNIPIRTPRGKEIRKAFVPANDQCILLAADYSQVELRIIASLSGDEHMIEAFLHGEDIHKATAAKVFGVSLDAVDREMRSKAKAVNFGIIYGQGAFGLSQGLGISRSEAKEIIDAYWKQFPRLREYQQENVRSAREKGFVETILGRRRYLPDIHSSNAVVRGFAERNAVNAPIQGSAADIIKVAMIRLHRAMKEYGMKSRMIMQVHDELVFDALKVEADALKELVRKEMCEAVKMQVPLVVEVNTGANWLEAH
ncbi:MAG: DNA polymerase I [Flavobacteriales bacterium]